MHFFNNEVLYILGVKVGITPRNNQTSLCSNCFALDYPYCMIRIKKLGQIYDCYPISQYYKQLKF